MKKLKRKRREEEEISYWLSYSDMMAALLLVFVLIITFTMLKSQEHVENLEIQKAELLVQQKQVEELIIQNEEKELELIEQQKLVEEQQEKLDKLIGVRTEIVEALIQEFEDTDLSVNIDDKTGAITFDASILFEFGKFELKDSGKSFLNEFLPRYVYILQSEEFQPYIAEIIIEGHTDSVGTYLNNLELSQNRALAVARYCLAEGESLLNASSMEKLRKIVTANGRSYSNLILKEDGTEDAEASRRVEFKFRLTEDEMIQEMKEILVKKE